MLTAKHVHVSVGLLQLAGDAGGGPRLPQRGDGHGHAGGEVARPRQRQLQCLVNVHLLPAIGIVVVDPGVAKVAAVCPAPPEDHHAVLIQRSRYVP